MRAGSYDSNSQDDSRVKAYACEDLSDASDEKSYEWQVYNDAFQTGLDRKTQIGPSFQVSKQAIPPYPSLHP